MIAKSDLIILVVSAGALAVGVYRWQQNLTQPPLATTNVRVIVGEPAGTAPDGTAPVAARPPSGATSPAADEASAPPVVRRLPADETGTAGSNVARDPGESTVSVTPGNAATAGTETPPAGPAVETTASTAGEGGEALYGVYLVSSGDYLGLIAERFGTSVSTLRSINGIEGSMIRIGQEIRYPLPAN